MRARWIGILAVIIGGQAGLPIPPASAQAPSVVPRIEPVVEPRVLPDGPGETWGTAYALAFGGDDYAVASSAATYGSAANFAVMGWINTSRLAGTAGIQIDVRGAAGFIYILINRGAATVTFRTSPLSTGSIVYTADIGGGWHHVAGVYSGGTLRILIDGVVRAGPTAASLTGSGTTWTTTIGAGNSGAANFSQCDITQVRVTFASITDGQVRQAMRTTRRLGWESAYYPMAIGSGQSVPDAAGSAALRLGSGTGVDTADPAWIGPYKIGGGTVR
jgi:hypothetical protein